MGDEARIEDYQDAFARMERRVDQGETDLSRLGFWRLVGRVKLEPRLAEHWADQVGRIDRTAFERAVRIRVPVWVGNLLLLVGTAVLIATVVVALRLVQDDPGSAVAGWLAVVAALGLSVTVHDPAHWVVGRLVGIRFSHYFLDGPTRMQPGLKIDYAAYLRASPSGRAWMHAAGAVASKIAPFAVFAALYLPHRASGYDLFPSWSLWAVLGFGVLQLITDLTFSVRASDWKKVRRERRLARAQRAERL
ncbi:MAG TPA: hypothetical protein VHH92_04070 [Actinomycetota bacterium]|nr:hypothetical protein [Actinomycetota bacterium]